MALFFSADIHQGDQRFSVHSRGKQCAFMSLSALLTARNIPLNLWSRITFKNALLQGDKMFLNALDSGFIILDQGVELLSVENLPTVVNVACCTNLFEHDFSYKICQTPVQAEATASPVMVTNNDLHIFEEPCEVQNNILETQTYSTELTTQSKTSPMRVIDTTSPVMVTNTTSPVRVTNTTSPVRVTNTTSPVMVTNTTSPVRVTNTTSPVKVTNTTSPVRVTDTDLPIVVQPVEAKTIIDPPIVVEPIEAITIIDSPIVVEPIEAQSVIKTKNTIDMSDEAENENQICSINYGAEFQGLVITDREIECHYYDIHTALLNAFLNDNYAILILEGYMMALVKQADNFYLFDSHARDSCGMPDPNGTAVVMKFANIHELEQHLYSLSIELHSNIFEVVPVQLNMCKASKQKTKCVNDQEYQRKRRSVETEGVKQARLKKASESKERKQSQETDNERQTRLQKVSESKKRKQSEETDSERQLRLQHETDSKKTKRSEETDSERQVRLQKKTESKKRKRSQETDSERQVRLQKETESKKRKRSQETDSERQIRLDKDRCCKKQKRAKIMSQPQQEISQQDYLNLFDTTNSGSIEEQCWAKTNINKFHKSVQYIVSHCTVCQEAWPLKSKPKSPYVCSRCCRDKKSPKKFSCENSMIPSPVPHELQNLTQIEEMLIARALPIMRVYIKPGGQRGYSGHCINLPQSVTELATSLPRYPKDLAVIIVKVKGRDNTFKDVTVRKQKVHNALVWLINNNPHYSELTVNEDALNSLPENGVPPDLMTVETDDDMVSDGNCSADVGPPTDNPSEDIVYNDSTEMSSFLPVGEQQQQEMEAVRNQLSENEPMQWPSVENEPLNEYQVSHLATMAFPTLFPDGKGDPRASERCPTSGTSKASFKIC